MPGPLIEPYSHYSLTLVTGRNRPEITRTRAPYARSVPTTSIISSSGRVRRPVFPARPSAARAKEPTRHINHLHYRVRASLLILGACCRARGGGDAIYLSTRYLPRGSEQFYSACQRRATQLSTEWQGLSWSPALTQFNFRNTIS